MQGSAIVDNRPREAEKQQVARRDLDVEQAQLKNDVAACLRNFRDVEPNPSDRAPFSKPRFIDSRDKDIIAWDRVSEVAAKINLCFQRNARLANDWQFDLAVGHFADLARGRINEVVDYLYSNALEMGLDDQQLKTMERLHDATRDDLRQVDLVGFQPLQLNDDGTSILDRLSNQGFNTAIEMGAAVAAYKLLKHSDYQSFGHFFRALEHLVNKGRIGEVSSVVIEDALDSAYLMLGILEAKCLRSPNFRAVRNAEKLRIIPAMIAKFNEIIGDGNFEE